MPTCFMITIVTCNGKDVANSNGLYTVNHSDWEHQLYNNSVVLNISMLIIEHAHNLISHAYVSPGISSTPAPPLYRA